VLESLARRVTTFRFERWSSRLGESCPSEPVARRDDEPVPVHRTVRPTTRAVPQFARDIGSVGLGFRDRRGTTRGYRKGFGELPDASGRRPVFLAFIRRQVVSAKRALAGSLIAAAVSVRGLLV